MSERPAHYADYADMSEIVPGVFVVTGEGVHIVDDLGEIVTWNCDEWVADTESVTAAICAVAHAAKYGATSLRAHMSHLNSVKDQQSQYPVPLNLEDASGYSAARAGDVLAKYAKDTGLSLPDEYDIALRDLLADLMHWADTLPDIDFDAELKYGRSHYESEVQDAQGGNNEEDE